jgi:hypothetical protein
MLALLRAASIEAAFCAVGYSIFDSALRRNLAAEWLFPQEKATFHNVTSATSESKML